MLVRFATELGLIERGSCTTFFLLPSKVNFFCFEEERSLFNYVVVVVGRQVSRGAVWADYDALQGHCRNSVIMDKGGGNDEQVEDLMTLKPDVALSGHKTLGNSGGVE